jgi:three-Cys-motif partner protein
VSPAASLNTPTKEAAPKSPFLRKNKTHQSGPALFVELDVPLITSTASERKARRFFDAQRHASAVKTKIIVDYFTAWANIMKIKTRSGKIGYFDFFAGPGVYDDGTESTPLQIMHKILADDRLRAVTLTLFEDKDPDAARSLSTAIAGIEGIDSLKYAPQISNGESVRKQIENFFKSRAVIPTFMFLDPYGYVGLTRELMQAILKDWGCEIAFYFNFNRINAAIWNSKVRSHMNALVGSERVEDVRSKLANSSDETTREALLLECMRSALYEIGAKHVLQFRFRKPNGQIDHHLIFVTKNPDPAQKVMKSIMARTSTRIDQEGVSSFEFRPRDLGPTLTLVDETPMQKLIRELPVVFRGQRVTVAQVYAAHNESTPFTIKNYQDALRTLAYDLQAVAVERGEFMPLTKNNLAHRHMSENYVITFPA